jgi:hypothetical protein
VLLIYLPNSPARLVSIWLGNLYFIDFILRYIVQLNQKIPIMLKGDLRLDIIRLENIRKHYDGKCVLHTHPKRKTELVKAPFFNNFSPPLSSDE